MDAIHIFILDDEYQACKNLENILLKDVNANLNIVGIAHSTAEAEIQLLQLKPDVLFLDIEMPHENAFEFLERISPFDFEIIFVTAYDAYAVKAFRLNAVDYILKPIDVDELKEGIEKLISRLLSRASANIPGISYPLLATQIAENKTQDHIILKTNTAYEIVSFNDILFVKAQGRYSDIVFLKHGVEVNILMSYPISEYEEILPQNIFNRVHRSYLVNRLHIDKIIKTSSGERFVSLVNHQKIPISRRRNNDVFDFLKNGL